MRCSAPCWWANPKDGKFTVLLTYHPFTSQDTEDADGDNQFRSIDHKRQVWLESFTIVLMIRVSLLRSQEKGIGQSWIQISVGCFRHFRGFKATLCLFFIFLPRLQKMRRVWVWPNLCLVEVGAVGQDSLNFSVWQGCWWECTTGTPINVLDHQSWRWVAFFLFLSGVFLSW